MAICGWGCGYAQLPLPTRSNNKSCSANVERILATHTSRGHKITPADKPANKQTNAHKQSEMSAVHQDFEDRDGSWAKLAAKCSINSNTNIFGVAVCGYILTRGLSYQWSGFLTHRMGFSL